MADEREYCVQCYERPQEDDSVFCTECRPLSQKCERCGNPEINPDEQFSVEQSSWWAMRPGMTDAEWEESFGTCAVCGGSNPITSRKDE